MKYDFISDPGHGWLKVKRKELERLGIAAKVSHYSYQRGQFVYLEEDCDTLLFVKAKEALGESLQYRVRYATYKASRVRNYEGYVFKEPWVEGTQKALEFWSTVQPVSQ